jgi:hypothetical protein
MINDSHIDFLNKLTPEEIKAFLRKVTGPPRRTLEGSEKENVWLMILLQDEPDECTNNQRTITEIYKINQKEYHVTYFDKDDFEIEEMLEDEV